VALVIIIIQLLSPPELFSRAYGMN